MMVGCATSTERATREEIHWWRLSEGLVAAKAQNKPLVVDFYTPEECARCRAMEKYVYSVPEIIRKLNTEFIPVRVDLSKPLTAQERALGEKYDYKNDCLLLFLDPQGEVIELEGQKLCFVDYVPPEWFLRYLQEGKRHLKQ